MLGVSSYIIYNLYNKVEYLTTYASNIVESIEIMRSRVNEMNSYIRAIDKRGSFEADDEVGIFFKDLKEVQDRLNILFSIVNENRIQVEEQQQDNPSSNGSY